MSCIAEFLLSLFLQEWVPVVGLLGWCVGLHMLAPYPAHWIRAGSNTCFDCYDLIIGYYYSNFDWHLYFAAEIWQLKFDRYNISVLKLAETKTRLVLQKKDWGWKLAFLDIGAKVSILSFFLLQFFASSFLQCLSDPILLYWTFHFAVKFNIFSFKCLEDLRKK